MAILIIVWYEMQHSSKLIECKKDNTSTTMVFLKLAKLLVIDFFETQAWTKVLYKVKFFFI